MRRTHEAETVAAPGFASPGPDLIHAPFETGADVARFDFGRGTTETAATGQSARIVRRPDDFARFPAAPARSHLTPGHEAAAVRGAARMDEAGTNAGPDAAGDAVSRHEARVVAAGTPFGPAGTTNPLGIAAVSVETGAIEAEDALDRCPVAPRRHARPTKPERFL